MMFCRIRSAGIRVNESWEGVNPRILKLCGPVLDIST
jgi:hypothetical protein